MLDDFHVREHQDWHLIQMLLEPLADAGRFVSAGRFAAVARALGVSIWELTSVCNEQHGSPLPSWVVDITALGPDPTARWLIEGAFGYPWPELGDLSALPEKRRKDAIRKRLVDLAPDLDSRELSLRAGGLGRFAFNASTGDRVIAVRGAVVSGVGVIEGPYGFDPGSPLAHKRTVTWRTPSRLELPVRNAEGAVFERMASPRNLIAIRRLELDGGLAPATVPRDEVPPVAPVAVLARRVHSVPRLSGMAGRIQAALERKGQVILYGPPGTGKTWWAERTALDIAAWEAHGCAWELLGEVERAALRGDGGSVRLVSFHPGYGYEDFIEGYRPVPRDGAVVFERRDGLFRRLCREAVEDRGRTRFLIVDETTGATCRGSLASCSPSSRRTNAGARCCSPFRASDSRSPRTCASSAR